MVDGESVIILSRANMHLFTALLHAEALLSLDATFQGSDNAVLPSSIGWGHNNLESYMPTAKAEGLSELISGKSEGILIGG